MADYRNIQLSFWTDSKIEDDFTPEDKYFYLFLMTNPLTSLCGCYECSKKQMSRYTGYSVETIQTILYRMEYEHNVIKYSNETKEVLLLNWHKHNWSNSNKVLRGVYLGALEIKCIEYRNYILNLLIGYGYPIDSGLFTEEYPMDKTFRFVSYIDSNNINNNIHREKVNDIDNTISSEDIKDIDNPLSTVEESTGKNDKYDGLIREIVSYLNSKTGSNFSPKTHETRKFISGRLSDGYSLDDFIHVIDKKTKEWIGTDQQKFLRPSTLFRESNFESYMNQKEIVQRDKSGVRNRFKEALEAIKEGGET